MTSTLLVSFAVSFGLLIIAMSVHEFSHALVAYKLGDNTALYSGRLTLNPLAHIDPVWTLLIPFLLYISSHGQFVFGAAKPVPINQWALKNPRRDMLLIGASGPVSNLVFAFLLSLLIKVIPSGGVLSHLLISLIVINVVLGVFNLIPLPPLDGSRILMGILPPSLSAQYQAIEPYAFIIIIVLMFMGVLGTVVWPLVSLILNLLGVG